jgi:hypothetical protein
MYLCVRRAIGWTADNDRQTVRLSGFAMTDGERIAFFERQAEDAYSRMYDATSASDAAARYSDAKEALHSALALANGLGQEETARRLDARLSEIKAVFRSQFS